MALQWLSGNAVPFAWLSLDEHDNRLEQFLNYLTAALRTVYPQLGQETEGMLRQPKLPKPEYLADSLLRDIQESPERGFLVLDDYHSIRNIEIHSIMRRLIQQQSANLHLVLLSRVDPPLALAKLRGRGQLQEIRNQDLRFTPNEVTILLLHFATGSVLVAGGIVLLLLSLHMMLSGSHEEPEFVKLHGHKIRWRWHSISWPCPISSTR